jgi:hypothetical protein
MIETIFQTLGREQPRYERFKVNFFGNAWKRETMNEELGMRNAGKLASQAFSLYSRISLLTIQGLPGHFQQNRTVA